MLGRCLSHEDGAMNVINCYKERFLKTFAPFTTGGHSMKSATWKRALIPTILDPNLEFQPPV